MGSRRLIEPRLTGGFHHGRLITLRSGETPHGLDAQPPAVLAAIARIRERAESDASPEAQGALGITYLVSGDVSGAVKALESASAQEPENARLLSDLAAAYLTRAAQADEPADIPKALEAAEKAIALKDAPEEAWFNRALALERLHLVDAARKAWDDYLQRDAACLGLGPEEARQDLRGPPGPVPRAKKTRPVRASLPRRDLTRPPSITWPKSHPRCCGTTWKTICCLRGPTLTSLATPTPTLIAIGHVSWAKCSCVRQATPCLGIRPALSSSPRQPPYHEIRSARRPSASKPFAKPSASTTSSSLPALRFTELFVNWRQGAARTQPGPGCRPSARAC